MNPTPHHPLRSAAARRVRGLCVLLLAAIQAPASGQSQAQPGQAEEVSYWNAADSTFLTATLVLPETPGPYPGVVLLSIAGTDPMVRRLVSDGYAVLMPVRRGFVSVEPLLRATYADLAADVRAGMRYLQSRPDVSASAIALVGQGDDAPAAVLAAAESESSPPLVLLEPPGLPGREIFRLEQRGQAVRGRARPADLQALEEYIGDIADIIESDDPAYIREYRLEGLIGRSDVQLPYNAGFPAADGGQAHFLGSPLWHDRFTFDAEAALGALRGPVLVIVGADPLDIPLDPHLEAVTRGLSGATGNDRTICLLEARPRHAFPEPVVAAVGSWLAERIGVGEGTEREGRGPLPGCLE